MNQPPGTPPRAQAAHRADYPLFRRLDTRWMDNDAYGHLNNVVYYSLFDTAVNAMLIEAGALDIRDGGVIGLVVENHCNYFAPLAFPQPVEAGLRVAVVGRSSVRYEIGLFAADQARAAACGHFVHVYVDRQTRRPVDVPEVLHRLLRGLQQPPEQPS